MKENINTNTRLFDLVRYMRAELHDADLISDEEYAWLTMEAEMSKSPEGGSPSPRRLEDYDEIIDKQKSMMDKIADLLASSGCLQLQITELEKENAKHTAAISLFLEGEEAAKQKVRELKKILEMLPIEEFIKDDYIPDAADFVDNCEAFLSAMRAASEALKEKDE